MKKVVVLLMLLVLTLSGCGKGIEASDENLGSSGGLSSTSPKNSEELLGMSGISFEEGVWSDKDWENVEFPFKKDCVPDKETAVNITRILIEKFQQQNYFSDYVLQSVFFDTEDKIWIVTYGESRNYPGACVSIAIRKENAEVIKIWVGE